MGGDLKAAPAGKAPTFLIRALRDADGANLDRVQVIKGWLDKDGKTQEKIYDVAWSDPQQRKPGADGKLPAVGNTVNVEQATYTNAIGAPALEAYWKRPGVRSRRARLLLRTRARNSHAALDDLRRQILRRETAGRRAGLDPGARLHLADLVHAVKRLLSYAGLLVAGALVVPPVVQACGYHDPRTIAFGALNLSYPKALYVRTAVWMAENAGMLPTRDPQAALNMFGFHSASADLRKLATRMSAGEMEREAVSIAVVLIELDAMDAIRCYC